MTVECPGCSTTFPVDPKKVPAGGVHARCSVCGEVFFVDVPSQASTQVQAVAVPEVEATAEPQGAPEGTVAPRADGYPEEPVASPEEELVGETAEEEHLWTEPEADVDEGEPAWAEPEGETAEEEHLWSEPDAETSEEEPSWAAPEAEPAEEEEPAWTEPGADVSEGEPTWAEPEGVTPAAEHLWSEPEAEAAVEEEPSWTVPEPELAEGEGPEPSFVPPTDEPLAETVEPFSAEIPSPADEAEAGEEEPVPVEDVPDLAEVTEPTGEVSPTTEDEPTTWEEEQLDEEATDRSARVEGEAPLAEPEGLPEAPGDREDLTEAFGEDAFAEEMPILEAADAEGTFRVDETPAEEELPFVGEVTPGGELTLEAGPEEEPLPAASDGSFQAEEPTFGEGELIFTMDAPGAGGDMEQAPGFALESTLPEEEPREELPEPPEEEPAPPPPPPPPLPTPQFGRRDPKEKAQRLARVLVSDIILYNPDRHQRALEQGRLKEEFEDEIQKSWNEYVEQVGSEIANGTDFFTDALNEILAKGRKTF